MNDHDHNAEIEQLRRWVAADKAEIERLNRLLVGVRNAFNRECDDLDAILHVLGLSPDNCRTDGGSLMLQDVLGKIKHREAALRYEARLHKDRADDCGRLARMVLDQECLSDEPQNAVQAAYGGLTQTSQG